MTSPVVVNLRKQEQIILSKNNNVTEVKVGLSWEASSTPNRPFDLDASVLLLDNNRKLVELVFYNNLSSQDGGVVHQGDELEGSSSASYEEEIHIDLSKVPAYVQYLAVSVSIHNAKRFGLNFGQVKGSLVDVLPKGGDTIRYNLHQTKETANSGAIIIAEIFRTTTGWSVEAGGKDYSEFAELLRDYGASV